MILAFDLGITETNPTALVVLSDDCKQLVYNYEFKSNMETDWDKRLWDMSRKLDIMFTDWNEYNRYDIKAVGYEFPYAMPKNLQTSIKLSHVGGMIVALSAVKCNVPVFGVKPTQVKKCLTGNGRAEKSDMIKAASILVNKEITTSHTADAIGVGLYISTCYLSSL